MATQRSIVVPDTRPSPSPGESFYRPGLDILRALAFLLVFLAHGLVANIDSPTQIGALARSGEFGVSIFFFLSSYLITELLLREKRDTGTIRIPAFYARRVLRIWPLYFAMIAVGWLYGLVSPTHTLSLGWIGALLLLCANWYTVDHGYPPGFLFPLWSISLEEQFYLLWPWLVKRLQPKALVGVAAALVVVAYVSIAVLLGRRQSLDPGLWANSLVQFQFFALGTITAILLQGRVLGQWLLRLSRPLRWLLLAAGLLCMRGAQAAAYGNDPVLPHDFVHIAPRYLAAMVGCVCLFCSLLHAPAGRIQRPCIYLGKISYGLYVYHVVWLGLGRDVLEHWSKGRLSPLWLQLTAMLLALPATIVTAMLSYRYLESPFLRFKQRFTKVSSRPL